MLKAIWPSIQHMKNHLPAGAKITTSGLMCYFLYWLIQVVTYRILEYSRLNCRLLSHQFPFMFVSPQRIRWLFFVKALIVPTSWLAMLIWAVVRVPASDGLFSQHSSTRWDPERHDATSILVLFLSWLVTATSVDRGFESVLQCAPPRRLSNAGMFCVF